MTATLNTTLESLEWDILTEQISTLAQSDEGQRNCRALSPSRTQEDIQERWVFATELRDLARNGYFAPIGELRIPQMVFRATAKGQILEGLECWVIFEILNATKRVLSFANAFAQKSKFLQRSRGQLTPLNQLLLEIEKTVKSDGSLLDTASEELALIRKQKTSTRKRIEDTIQKVIQDPDVAEYLQDNFFTIRHERYVIPMRLDGRGRIKGQIIDTSDSGQTLFLEPTAIAALNSELHDLEVAEKLEIIRIFRDLSAHIARELTTIETNYRELIALDQLTAESRYAVQIDAGAVHLSQESLLDLKQARHPLIRTSDGKGAEPNNISLESKNGVQQHVLIVSGPNAGGKTVVLKTTGMLHLMARAGLLIPADPDSRMFLFKHVFIELGDGQSVSQNLSTFSSHLLGLKPILEQATGEDLVLLDELATGTEPITGAAIARSVLEHLGQQKVTAIATTHYDQLKSLAFDQKIYRNASMEYAEQTLRPTYRLILDVPGQSYGLELASQMGIPLKIIERARALKGTTQSSMDEAVALLQKARIESENLRKELQQEVLNAQSAKSRWEEECRLLEEQRTKAAKSLAAKLETKVDHLKSEFEDQSRELREAVKELRTGQTIQAKDIYEKRKEVESKLKHIEKTVYDIANTSATSELPGQPVSEKEIKVGLNVYVLPLKKEGVITKIGTSTSEGIEVQVGIVKLRVGVLDLRKTRGPSEAPKNQSSKPTQKTAPAPEIPLPEFVPQTKLNTLDVRGTDVDSAVERTLRFIDQSLLNHENLIVIVHGHGGDRLKNGIRTMLRTNCPYPVRFRPGSDSEGGDGVTVIGIS